MIYILLIGLIIFLLTSGLVNIKGVYRDFKTLLLILFLVAIIPFKGSMLLAITILIGIIFILAKKGKLPLQLKIIIEKLLKR